MIVALRSLRVAPWKRYLVVRAGLQLGRDYAIAATGLPVAAKGETPGAQ